MPSLSKWGQSASCRRLLTEGDEKSEDENVYHLQMCPNVRWADVGMLGSHCSDCVLAECSLKGVY